MFKYRLITSIIMIPIVIIFIFFLSLPLFISVISIICTLSSWEWGKLSGLNTNVQRTIFSLCFCLLLIFMSVNISIFCPFITFLTVKYTILSSIIWWPIALLLIISYPRFSFFWDHSKILRLSFGILTILPFFWSVLVLRQLNLNNINHFAGSLLLLNSIVVIWSMDIGSYVFGRLLGKHKLASQVSSNKTWEGFFGGIFTAMVIAILFSIYIPLNVNRFSLFLCSIMTAPISVLGDLTESMLKRTVCVKDSGNIFPGHGGILDRIDSLTSSIPIFVYYTILITKLV